jgi:predicted DCC family thiol-disulfide oxidoreductase YuxK
VLPVTNGWTGGQYSIYRILLGSSLAVRFAELLPSGAELFSGRGTAADADASPPIAVAILLILGTALAACFALGAADRLAAVALAALLACLVARNPGVASPSLLFVGGILLAHACIPGAPYGALRARARSDPGGGWRMPGGIFRAAWIVLAAAYAYGGYTRLVNPLARDLPLPTLPFALPEPVVRAASAGALGLELAFAPLALLPRARPWVWLALLGLQLLLGARVDLVDLSAGMLMLQLLTFDPAWVAPRRDTRPALLFYDGGCGLCHRAVRFVLAEDRDGLGFRFAPLAGAAFERAVPPALRAALPDSLVLVTPAGLILVRAEAAREVGRRLGGLWRVLALISRALPTPWLDRAYDGIARVRHRLFARPPASCPLLPPELFERFDQS